MSAQPRLVGITFRQRKPFFWQPSLVLQVVTVVETHGFTNTHCFDAQPEHLPILAAAGLLNLNALPQEKP